MSSRNRFKPDPDDFIFLVMGPTGTGKTNFINALNGNVEQHRGHLKFDDTHVVPHVISHQDIRVVLVETPGFDDTYRPDSEILRIIADWLIQKYPDGTTLKIAGIIYLHRITDNRMSGSVARNLEMFGRLCGNIPLPRTRLVTTMWDMARDQAVALQREAQLKSDFWRKLIDGGAVVLRFQNTRTSAMEILGSLLSLGNDGEELLLQEELVEQQKRLNETEAGKVLYNRLQKLFSEQRRMLKDLAEEAKRQNDPALAKSLQEEYDKIDAQLQRTFEEIQEMKIPLSRRILLWLFGRKSRAARISTRISVPSATPSEPVKKVHPQPQTSSKPRAAKIVRDGSVRGSAPRAPKPNAIPFLGHFVGNAPPDDVTNQITRDGRDPVASGGFADIYRGKLRRNGESIQVAIKAIKTYSSEDGDFTKKQKRPRREIKVWLTLTHPNVLPLLGITTKFGRFPAMVSPWVDRGTLTSYLKEHYDNLSLTEILRLLSDVASGLQYHSAFTFYRARNAHLQSNVLVCKDGRAYIADFGLSMLLTELGGTTFATSFRARGTLRWTAPELLDLKVPEEGTEDELPRVTPTTQSDVYSFGSVMYQILSGKVPYHYYAQDGQVVLAVSQGMTPARPCSAPVTDHRWTFTQRCWSSVDTRPSGEEIVEFTGEEFVSASSA